MEDLKQQMINEAKVKYDDIRPLGNKERLEDCFTTHDDNLLFWFNINSNTTRLLTRQIIAS